MLRSLLLALVISCAADAADPTLNVRSGDAMAGLQPPFAMQRTAAGGETIYQGSTSAAMLTLRVRGDFVSKAELATADATVPDAKSSQAYLMNFGIRGRFLTNMLPSWHASALKWTDETVHELSPAAIAGRPQTRTTTREGVELRLDLRSAGEQNGHAILRLMLTVQPESTARR